MSETESDPKKKTPAKKVAKKAAVKKVAKKAAPAKKTTTKTDAPAKKVPAKKATAKTDTSEKKAVKTPKKASPKSISTQSHENEFVKVNVDLTEGCNAVLEVEISEKVMNEAYTSALKEVSKNISVPGFRKGKVPREMIQKNYAAHIEEQSDNLYMQKGLEHALVLSKLRPLNYRNVKPKVEHKSKTEAKVIFSFETYPIVPEVVIDNIKLKKVEIEDISQDRIDEVIDVMRTYRAKWEAVEDRGVEKDDFVEVDIENVEDKSKIVSQKRVQVAKGKLSSWIIKLLTGMKKGESKEGMSKWDDEVMPKEEKKDFKATKCKVTVLSIATADLPEVDEEFSKAMGTQSVADLRTQVMLRLKGNAESVADGKQREDIDDQLVKLIDFEIPKSLIDAEIKTKTQLKEQELKQANFSDEDIKKKEKETEKEAHEAAIRSLKLFFIFQKLANDHNIIVPEKELLEVVSERVSQLNLPAEFKSSPQFNNHIIQEIRMNCFVELLSDKVKRYLLKKVIPT